MIEEGDIIILPTHNGPQRVDKPVPPIMDQS